MFERIINVFVRIFFKVYAVILPLFLVLSVFQVILGTYTVSYYHGWYFAIPLFILITTHFCFVPFVIASYFGMTGLIGWDPAIAVLLTIPTILYCTLYSHAFIFRKKFLFAKQTIRSVKKEDSDNNMFERLKDISIMILSVCFLGTISVWLFVLHMFIATLGIEHYFGTTFAILAVASFFKSRFTLHLSIGAYFGMTEVLGLNSTISLIILVPSAILFMWLAPLVVTHLRKWVASFFNKKEVVEKEE